MADRAGRPHGGLSGPRSRVRTGPAAGARPRAGHHRVALLGGLILGLAGLALPGTVSRAAAAEQPAALIVPQASAPAADAKPFTVATARWAGADRYATAAAISAAVFKPGVPAAFITSGDNFPDALGGAAAAGKVGGPILTVPSRGGLPSVVTAELRRLAPRVIYVLGGAAAVPSATARALVAYATSRTVTRLAGTDRYATSAATSAAFFHAGVPVVFIATGDNFPDALVAGPSAVRAHGPVLLVHSGSATLPPAVAAELARLKPGKIIALGSTAVVSDALLAQAASYATGHASARLAGADRYATAAAVEALDPPAVGKNLLVASGQNFPDAEAAGPAAAAAGDALLLTNGAQVPAAIATAIGDLAPRTVVAIGSTAVVPDAALSTARTLSQARYLPTATFSKPAGATFTPASSVTVHFTAQAGLGGSLASGTMTEATSPLSADGTCDQASWTPVDIGAPVAASPFTFSGLAPETCYQFGVALVDTDGATATSAAGAVRTLSPWTGSLDLYVGTAFSTQATYTWCVAANSQEVSNIVTGAADHSKSSQQTIQAYAIAHSLHTYSDGGADADGWAAAINRFAGTVGYHDVSTTTYDAALAGIAAALRDTGRPVGVAVADGTHAWTVVGVTAADDPATGGGPVDGVFVTGSLYPTQQVDGYDLPPDTYLTADQFAQYLTPYHDANFSVPWEGLYVSIQP